MPLYEYECRKCSKRVERIEKFDGPHLQKCAKCGGRLERMASAPAIRFKGSGWYVNDYARSSPGNKAGTDEGASEKADAKPDGKSAGKPEEKPAAGAKEKKKPASKDK